MVVAGSDSAVIMVESEAKEWSEDQMLGGILFAQQEIQPVIEALKEMANEVGKSAFEYEPKTISVDLINSVENQFLDNISEAYSVKDKQERVKALSEIKEKMVIHVVVVIHQAQISCGMHSNKKSEQKDYGP